MRKVRLLAAMVALMLLVGLMPTGAVTAAGKPDLTVTVQWNTETEVKPGTAVTFSATVKNEGTAASEAAKVTIGTLTQTMLDTTVDGLAAGESVTVTAQPWVAVKGDYMIVATVNGDKAAAESDYKNDTAQANLRVADKKLVSAHETTAKMLADGGLTKLVFSDDFDSVATVDVNDTGVAGYKWYVDRPYGAVTLTPEDYSVKNGIMTVHNVIPTYNYGLGTVHPLSHAGFTFNTGYLEVRLRIPRPRENAEGEKGVPAIWALPPEKLYGNDTHWVEFDWLEYWGDNYYTVCLHEQISNEGSVYQHNKNSNVTGHGLGDGDWHVMGWLWQEGVVITYYDGVEVMRLRYAEGEHAEPMHTTVKGNLQTGVFVHLDGQQMPVFIGGSKDNPMELDYVRVWDGNDTYVPPVPTYEVMTMDEFWTNFAADENMEPYTEVNAYNYEQILAGELEWNRLPLATKNEVAGFMMGIGQPVYLKLLEQAKAVRKNPSAYTTAATVTTTTKAPVVTTKKPTTVRPTGSTATTTTVTAAVETTTEAVGTVPTTTVSTAPTTATAVTPTTEGAQPPDGGMPGWAIPVAAVGMLVLCGAVAAVLWLSKKKAPPSDTE